MKLNFAQIYTEFISRVQAIQNTIHQDHVNGIIDPEDLRGHGVTMSSALPQRFENQRLATEQMLVTSALAAIPSAGSTHHVPDISSQEILPDSVAQYWSTQVMEPIRGLLQVVRSTFDPDDEDLDNFYTFARTQLRKAPGAECSDERQAARIVVLVLAASMPAEG